MSQQNAAKVFQFAIEIDGLDQMLVQELKRPEVEVGVVEHGATNYNIKTAGGVAVSAAELRKIKPAVGGDKWAWDWLNKAQNMNTGQGGLASAYKKDIVVKELSPTGSTISAWLWEGAWVSKIAPSDNKRGNQNENVIETCTIQVDRVKPLK